MALCNRDRGILDFERCWWQVPGRKDVKIRSRFNMSTTRYYEILNALLEDADAMQYDPLLVRRLRLLRARRRRARFEGPTVSEPRGR